MELIRHLIFGVFLVFNTSFSILNENEILNCIHQPIHNDCGCRKFVEFVARETSVENDIKADPIKANNTKNSCNEGSICEFDVWIFIDAFAQTD